jgi:hypothetical protein
MHNLEPLMLRTLTQNFPNYVHTTPNMSSEEYPHGDDGDLSEFRVLLARSVVVILTRQVPLRIGLVDICLGV